MIDRIPRRLRVAFTHDTIPAGVESVTMSETPDFVDFVAYGADCVLSGRTILDGDRLSDMLNEHDEYALIGVTVERFDGGPALAVDDVVVSRSEIWMVHAGAPRGVIGRRMRTSPQHVAIKMGPYQVRGFIHGLPGSDAVASLGRRKAMIPITNARIEYTMLDDEREVWVETLVINREQIDWLTAIEPDRGDFPTSPRRTTVVKSSLLAGDAASLLATESS
jgi:hypothetical protein